MYLEQAYLRRGTVERLRAVPLGWVLDGFGQWLQERGSSLRTIREHVTRAGALFRRLRRTGEDLSSEQAAAMLMKLELSSCRGDSCRERRRRKSTLRRLREYLEEEGLVKPEPQAPKVYDPVLLCYEQWLRNVRGSCPGTIERRRQCLVPFLECLGEEARIEALCKLDAERIRAYVTSRSAEYSKSHRNSICSTLRLFLRFCFHHGHTSGDLSGCVPSVRIYKLADTPRGIKDEQAEKVLTAVDRSRAIGKRDYAILQLLYTYGIRGGQVRALLLEDVDWRNDSILFRPLKRGKRSLLPLTEAVGESLLDYLENGRPSVSCAHVFVTMVPPCHPLDRSQALSSIVARRIKHANVSTPSNGAHAFRHCFAGRMVNRGHSLKAIADILGHRQLATTFIYTKVDFRSLAQVAMEWPEVSI
jgi:integrase/recombinase XerD